ncbi:MAG TPA: GAF domain-containing protein [Patescibacteria group bacterium]|jgi:GAF domain-containing protein|nr:GAF domain-containing protein [Patescibacteria group bacterium]
MRPTDRLAVENDRLRLRIEALERLAAESRQAEEARRQSEEETRRGAEERRRRENAVLGRLAADVNASLNLDSILKRVAEGARELSDGDVAGVALREIDSDAMVFRYWSGVHGVNTGTLRVDGGTGLAARVMSLGRAVRTDRYASDPQISKEYVEVAERETIASLLAVPIVVGSRVEGIIYVGNQLPRAFTELDETSVQRLADRAGLAIQNARLFRGHTRRQEELAVLYDILRAVTGPLAPDKFVEAVHSLLGRVLDARRLLMLRRNADARAFELVWASAPGWSAEDTGLETLVFERNRVIRTADYLATCQAEGVAPSAFAHGLRHGTIAPMSLADRAVGVLALWSADRGYSRADEELVTTVAALSALRLTR